LTEPLLPYYIERGSGDTAVVFLHGIGGGKEIWQAQLDGFAAQGYHAVAWDMPGYGMSPMVPHYSFATFAAALSRALDSLAARRVVLVGHSMGGMVALEAAVRFPQRLAALVLACTSPAFGKQEGAWQQAFIRARTRPLDEGRTMLDLARELVPTLLGPKASEQARRMGIGVMSRVPPETYRAALGALVRFDRRPDLPGIAIPTLALAGEQDRTAPPDVLERMAQHMPNARYGCLPDAGHLANIEQPDAFNAAVLDFLREALP
jgi:pimeloyl-ACP methyl ester carboxylesterase